MDCRRFEELLLRRVDGPLEAAGAQALDAHRAACPRCRELEALLAAPPPADLLGAVLEATLVDPGDPAWAGALARLARELPGLAEVEPDATFLHDVLAATSGARRPASSAARPRRRRLAGLQALLLQRPRFALEIAYVGTVAVMLAMGLVGGAPAAAPAAGSPGGPAAPTLRHELASAATRPEEIQGTISGALVRFATTSSLAWMATGTTIRHTVGAAARRTMDGVAAVEDTVQEWQQALSPDTDELPETTDSPGGEG